MSEYKNYPSFEGYISEVSKLQPEFQIQLVSDFYK